MATDMLQYLDPDGLDETVLNIGQIKTSLEGQISDLGESIEEELQNLSYARPDGIYPDMTVGAVIGADETAQWATRESTGSGSAIVRSVQGASEVQDGELVPVRIAGMKSIGFNQFNINDYNSINAYFNNNVITALSNHVIVYLPCLPNTTYCASRKAVATNERLAIGWTTEIPADGVTINGVQNAPTTPTVGENLIVTTTTGNNAKYIAVWASFVSQAAHALPLLCINYSDPARNGEYEPYRIVDSIEWTEQTLRAAGVIGDMLYADHKETKVGVVDLGTLTWTYNSELNCFAAAIAPMFPAAKAEFHGTCLEYPFVGIYQNRVNKSSFYIYNVYVGIQDTSFNGDVNACKAALDGVMLWYELATPTTTPISPALPMTYKVQQGGSESIIVPDGEISAAPILTVAEPVNMSTELARIRAAIESLGYTRNAAQLSRPVSLTDIGSIDETQKDTAEIDNTKEVTE